MRIGTWNLEAKWSEAHQALLADEDCDVWLLTEVNPKTQLTNAKIADYHLHLSKGVMAPGQQHWAAILSRTQHTSLPDLHETSAAACINGITYCSTVLPWRGCRRYKPHPWVGSSLAEMAQPAIERLTEKLPKSTTVWGGDWNQNLAGDWQHVGSKAMREVIESALLCLDLRVPTAKLPFQTGAGRNTIDHIAVPSQWFPSCHAMRVSAVRLGQKLSDHDAYVIEVDPK